MASSRRFASLVGAKDDVWLAEVPYGSYWHWDGKGLSANYSGNRRYQGLLQHLDLGKWTR